MSEEGEEGLGLMPLSLTQRQDRNTGVWPLTGLDKGEAGYRNRIVRYYIHATIHLGWLWDSSLSV